MAKKTKNPKLISKAEFSRRCNVSKAAITKATRKGCHLFPAMVNGKIDANHTAAKDFLQNSDIRQRNAAGPSTGKKSAKKKTAAGKKEADDSKSGDQADGNGTYDGQIPINIENYEDMTVKEVAMRYGGLPGFKVFIDALKGIADYKTKDVKSREARGDLVKRQTMEIIAFGLIDLAFKRLVNEYPVAIAPKLIGKVKSKKKSKSLVLDVEKLIRGPISKELKGCKRDMLKRFKRIEKK